MLYQNAKKEAVVNTNRLSMVVGLGLMFLSILFLPAVSKAQARYCVDPNTCITCVTGSCELTGDSSTAPLSVSGPVNCGATGRCFGNGEVCGSGVCFDCSATGCPLKGLDPQSVANGTSATTLSGPIGTLLSQSNVSCNPTTGVCAATASAPVSAKASSLLGPTFPNLSTTPNANSTTTGGNGESKPETSDAGKDSRIRDIVMGDDKENIPWQEFNGWSELYEGYNQPPNLFDPKNPNTERQYPELASKDSIEEANSKAGNNGRKRSSLESENLGVDDEVYKSSMAIFRPLRQLKEEDAESETFRDDYLDRFQTMLGVSQSTLSFLDKTVAAALTSSDAIINQNTTQHMIKQIAWATNKMANPNRSHVFLDTEEKLSACLKGNGKSEDDRIQLANCDGDDKCGKADKGVYSYCVCCAELSTKINSTIKDGDEGEFRVSERIFFGAKGPEGDKADYMKEVVEAFREVYGDIIVEGKDDTDGVITTRYEYPRLSLPMKINAIRDGCSEGGTCQGNANGQCTDPKINDGTFVCPITGVKVKNGIYKSLVSLIRAFPFGEDQINAVFGSVGGSGNTNFENAWIEASVGRMVTAADIARIRALGDISEDLSSKSDWEPEGRLRRFLNAFADSSALSAFKRFHVRMQSVVYDHMQLSQKATPDDKQRILDLLGRVTANFALAEEDARADYQVEAALQGASIESSKKQERNMAATVEAMRNMARMSGDRTSTMTFANPFNF